MAGQITWKNIEAPSGNAVALKIAGEAYDNMGDTLDPIKKVLDRRQEQYDDNYAQETKNIDVKISDSLTDLKSLAQFNEADAAGQLETKALTDEYGTRIDREAFEKNKLDRQTDLRGDAKKIAYGAGMKASDAAYDTDAGTQVHNDTIISLGGSPEFAAQSAAKYKNDTAVFQSRYNDEIEKTTLDYMSGKTFKDNASIETMIADGRKKHPKLFNPDAARKLATRELAGGKADTEYAFNEQQRARTELVHDIKGSALTLFSQGKTYDEIKTKLINTIEDSGTRVDAEMAVTGMLKVFANPDAQETIEYAGIIREIDNKRTAMKDAHGQQTAVYKKIIKDNITLNDPVVVEIEELIQEKGIKQALSGMYEKGPFSGAVNGFFDLFNLDTITGTSAKKYGEKQLENLLKDKSLTESEAYHVWAHGLKQADDAANFGTNKFDTVAFGNAVKRAKKRVINSKTATINLTKTQNRQLQETTAFNSTSNTLQSTLAKAITGYKQAKLESMADPILKTFKPSVDPIYEKMLQENAAIKFVHTPGLEDNVPNPTKDAADALEAKKAKKAEPILQYPNLNLIEKTEQNRLNKLGAAINSGTIKDPKEILKIKIEIQKWVEKRRKEEEAEQRRYNEQNI
jgi:hypothetical protein